MTELLLGWFPSWMLAYTHISLANLFVICLRLSTHVFEVLFPLFGIERVAKKAIVHSLIFSSAWHTALSLLEHAVNHHVDGPDA